MKTEGSHLGGSMSLKLIWKRPICVSFVLCLFDFFFILMLSSLTEVLCASKVNVLRELKQFSSIKEACSLCKSWMAPRCWVVHLDMQVLLWIWDVNFQSNGSECMDCTKFQLPISLFRLSCTINDWMGSAEKACPDTMTADKSEAGELALEPLLTCKLCLCEYSRDKMTTLQECNCVFCTAVRSVSAFTLQKQGNGRWLELWDGIAYLVQEACVTPMLTQDAFLKSFCVSLSCLI